MMQNAFCYVTVAPIRLEKTDRSEMISQLLFGEVVQIQKEEGGWCFVTAFLDNYEGWVEIKLLKLISQKELGRWLDASELQLDPVLEILSPSGIMHTLKGSYISWNENAAFNIGAHTYEIRSVNQDLKFQTIEDFALSYLNAPYLWGGKGPFGIDCSAFVQVVYRYFDINLPRDAYQQAELGREVHYDEMQAGDLAFFQNKEGRVVHVGIVMSQKMIIHASGTVRIDIFNEAGIFNSELESLTHQLLSIKRI